VSERRAQSFAVVAILLLFCTSCGVVRFIATHDYEVNGVSAEKAAVWNRELQQDKDYVVLIHGYGSKSSFMEPIADLLTDKGYRVVNIQYPTTDSIESIADIYITSVLQRLDSRVTTHFVTHSMGSVVLRYYLQRHSMSQLGKVVFVAPPSHGSPLADLALARWLRSGFGSGLLQLGANNDSFVNSLPKPSYSCYVLAGNSGYPIFSWLISGKDDGLVATDSAPLEGCKFKLITGVAHHSIVYDKRTLDEIENYLK
jgi:triacylglycerol esterase/lipase EstA (alpha/beta hydrolase family)